MIKVGFIGAGTNTKRAHLPKLIEQDDVKAIGVANRTLDSSKKVANEFNIEKVYDSWVDLLEDDQIDAVCIGTWPNMHAPLTLMALEAEKHVLCEARMAMNYSQAVSMLECSQTYPDLVVQIVPAPHTLPYDNTIKKWVQEKMGDLILLDVKATTGDFVDMEKPLHWRENRDLSGNNVMHMGIFYEAAMRWLGTASSVSAHSNIVVKKRFDENTKTQKEITIPDHLEAIGSMAIGGSFHMTHSTVLGAAPSIDIWIYGTQGTMHIYESSDVDTPQAYNSVKLKIEIQTSGSNKWEALLPKPTDVGGWRVEEEFISAIKGNEQITHTSFTDGVKYMEFADALKMSWESKSTIHLPFTNV
ncbi:MAG: hypothetical protein CL506_04230 [Actinobacteria bacterium]|nr:hypothetical protein [Actinomycetota bacterium]